MALALLTIAVAPRFIPGLAADDAGASSELVNAESTTTAAPESTTTTSSTAAPTTSAPSETSEAPTTTDSGASTTSTTGVSDDTTPTTDPSTSSTTSTTALPREGVAARVGETFTTSPAESTTTTTTTKAPVATHVVGVVVVDADGVALAVDDIAVAGSDDVFSSIGSGVSEATTPPLPEDSDHSVRATRNGVSVSANVRPTEGATAQLAFSDVDLAVSVVDGDGDALEAARIEYADGGGWAFLASDSSTATHTALAGDVVELRAAYGGEYQAVEATVGAGERALITFADVRDVVTLRAVDRAGNPVVVSEIQVYDGSWRSVATDAASVEVTDLGENVTRYVRMLHHGQWKQRSFRPSGESETISIVYEFGTGIVTLLDQNGDAVVVPRIQGYGADRTWRDIATETSTSEMTDLVVGNTYYFRAYHHGLWKQVSLVATAGSVESTIRYETGAVARFTLVDSAGDPVTVSRIQGYGADRSWRDIATNASQAEMTDLLVGNTYYFRAYHHGQWEQVTFTTDAAATEVSHTYASNGVARLRILDENGDPVRASLIQGYGGDRTWRDIATDASSAELTNLLIGNIYYFRALHHGRWSQVQVDTASAESAVEIRYETTSATFDLVDQDGSPVTVSRIQGYDGDRTWRDLATDAATAEMTDLVVGGTYYFRALHHGQWKQVLFTARSGDNAQSHQYRTTSATFRLVDQAGNPVTVSRIQGYGGDRTWRDIATDAARAEMADLLVDNLYYFRALHHGQWKQVGFTTTTGDNSQEQVYELTTTRFALEDQDGAPVVASRIQGYGGDRAWRDIATDASSAEMTGLVVGNTYYFRALVQGAWKQERFVAASGDHTVTQPYHFVDTSVRLVDDNGAAVIATHIQGYGTDRAWTQIATDASGARLSGLSAGNTYYFRALYHGHWKQLSFVAEEGADQTITFEMTDAALALLDEAGNPIAATQIQSYISGRGWTTVSNGGSSATMRRLVAGNYYYFRALVHGQWKQERFLAVSGGTTVTIQYQLEDVTFRVVDGEGTPLEAEVVRVYGADRRWAELGRGIAGAKVENWVVGNTYYFQALHHGKWHGVTVRPVASGANVFDVVIPLSSTRFELLDQDANPVAAREIQGYVPGVGWSSLATDAASFEMTGLAVGGTYHVRSQFDGRWTQSTFRQAADRGLIQHTVQALGVTVEMTGGGEDLTAERLRVWVDGRLVIDQREVDPSVVRVPHGADVTVYGEYLGVLKMATANNVSAHQTIDLTYDVSRARVRVVDPSGAPLSVDTIELFASGAWSTIATDAAMAGTPALHVGTRYQARATMGSATARQAWTMTDGATVTVELTPPATTTTVPPATTVPPTTVPSTTVPSTTVPPNTTAPSTTVPPTTTVPGSITPRSGGSSNTTARGPNEFFRGLSDVLAAATATTLPDEGNNQDPGPDGLAFEEPAQAPLAQVGEEGTVSTWVVENIGETSERATVRVSLEEGTTMGDAPAGWSCQVQDSFVDCFSDAEFAPGERQEISVSVDSATQSDAPAATVTTSQANFEVRSTDEGGGLPLKRVLGVSLVAGLLLVLNRRRHGAEEPVAA